MKFKNIWRLIHNLSLALFWTDFHLCYSEKKHILGLVIGLVNFWSLMSSSIISSCGLCPYLSELSNIRTLGLSRTCPRWSHFLRMKPLSYTRLGCSFAEFSRKNLVTIRMPSLTQEVKWINFILWSSYNIFLIYEN